MLQLRIWQSKHIAKAQQPKATERAASREPCNGNKQHTNYTCSMLSHSQTPHGGSRTIKCWATSKLAKSATYVSICLPLKDIRLYPLNLNDINGVTRNTHDAFHHKLCFGFTCNSVPEREFDFSWTSNFTSPNHSYCDGTLHIPRIHLRIWDGASCIVLFDLCCNISHCIFEAAQA